MYHPTLEGHPAWEAYKRAPVDETPYTDEQLADIERAKAGPFTRVSPTLHAKTMAAMASMKDGTAKTRSFNEYLREKDAEDAEHRAWREVGGL